MSLEQEQKNTQSALVEDHTPTDKQAQLGQMPKTIRGQIAEPTAFVTHRPFAAFLVGMASATGAGISMAFSEALSDNGELTGRGSPVIRGGITGIMTFFGGALHTLPFLIANLQIALIIAYVVVAFELVVISAIRHRYFKTSWWVSFIQVVGSGALVFVAALLFGNG